MTIKLALAGCGDICNYHYKSIIEINREQPNSIIITTIIDLDITKAQQYQLLCKDSVIYTSIEEALEKGDFDFITLMLPHHIHEKYACLCLSKNKHVLLEKPIALTLDSAKIIYNLAIKNDRILWITEQAQYWPEILYCKQLIDNGEIGELITMEVYYHEIINENENTPFNISYGEEQWRMNNNYSGGGILIDGGLHWIRAIRILMGEIKNIHSIMSKPYTKMDGESMVKSILEFENGKYATFNSLVTNSLSNIDIPWFYIIGTKKHIKILPTFSDFQNTKTIEIIDNNSSYIPKYGNNKGFFSGFSTIYKNILEFNKNNKRDYSNVVSAIKDLEVVLTIYNTN